MEWALATSREMGPAPSRRLACVYCFIPEPLLSFHPIFTAIDAVDLELPLRLDCIPLPDSAGRMIWPFVETAVFMTSKIESYSVFVNALCPRQLRLRRRDRMNTYFKLSGLFDVSAPG
jgi:hypothetical protein